jgi:hypothetical protein
MAKVRGAIEFRRICAMVVKCSTDAVGSTACTSRRTSAAAAAGSDAVRTTRCFENAPCCQNDR